MYDDVVYTEVCTSLCAVTWSVKVYVQLPGFVKYWCVRMLVLVYVQLPGFVK